MQRKHRLALVTAKILKAKLPMLLQWAARCPSYAGDILAGSSVCMQNTHQSGAACFTGVYGDSRAFGEGSKRRTGVVRKEAVGIRVCKMMPSAFTRREAKIWVRRMPEKGEGLGQEDAREKSEGLGQEDAREEGGGLGQEDAREEGEGLGRRMPKPSPSSRASSAFAFLSGILLAQTFAFLSGILLAQTFAFLSGILLTQVFASLRVNALGIILHTCVLQLPS